jgi:hypothetical protein
MFVAIEPRHRILKVENIIDQLEMDDCPHPEIPEALAPYVRGRQGDFDNEEIAYTFRLGMSAYCSAMMDSCLIIGTPIPEIARVTGTPEDVVMIYSQLFFDSTVFMGNRIFKSEYIHKLDHEDEVSRARKEMFKLSWKLGLNYIKYTLGQRDDVDIPCHIRDLFLLAYYNTHVYSVIPWREDNDISSAWAKQSVSLANLAEKKQNPFDMEHLKTKLTSEEYREDQYPDEEYFS